MKSAHAEANSSRMSSDVGVRLAFWPKQGEGPPPARVGGRYSRPGSKEPGWLVAAQARQSRAGPAALGRRRGAAVGVEPCFSLGFEAASISRGTGLKLGTAIDQARVSRDQICLTLDWAPAIVEGRASVESWQVWSIRGITITSMQYDVKHLPKLNVTSTPKSHRFAFASISCRICRRSSSLLQTEPVAKSGWVSVRSIRFRHGSVFRFRCCFDLRGPKPMLDRACCHINVSVSIGSTAFRFRSEPPPLWFRAAQVGAKDDREQALSARNPNVSAPCPVVLCPYSRTSEWSKPSHKLLCYIILCYITLYYIISYYITLY